MCHGSVVQWIEFEIPVLTMKVRILSESLMGGLVVAHFFILSIAYIATQRYENLSKDKTIHQKRGVATPSSPHLHINYRFI